VPGEEAGVAREALAAPALRRFVATLRDRQDFSNRGARRRLAFQRDQAVREAIRRTLESARIPFADPGARRRLVVRFESSIFVVSSAVLVSMASAASHAAVVCVDPDKATCEATVQAGVNAANAGDTVSIGAGVFLESVSIPVGKNGLILRGKRSVLDSSPLGLPGIEVLSSNVQITGVVVRNADGVGIDVQAGADGAKISKVTVQNADSNCIEIDANGVTVENSTIVACGSLVISGAANDVVIRNNRMKLADSGGIIITSNNAVIERNEISNIEDGNCINVTGNDAEVVSNRIVGCDSEGVRVDGEAPFIVKNQVSAGSGFEIDCTADCGNGLVSGNRVSNTSEDDGGFDIDAAAPGLVVTKNRVEKPMDEGFYLDGAGSMTVTNNQVRDAGGDNYEPCYEIQGTGGHTLERNTCDGTPDDGFYVVSGTGHTLEGNRVVNAFEDGIDVEAGTSITIERNQVSAGASGIEVGAGVTGSVTNNKVSGGRVDFCDESAGGVTNTGNNFATTAGPACATDVE
jgi:hypothetical protein